MSTSDPFSEDRSVHIGRDAHGNIIQTGDQNTATLHYERVKLPAPEQVDIAAELAAIRALLLKLSTPDQGKMERALKDAQDELTKATPDKDEVGKALDRALDYAKKASGFAESLKVLSPHVIAAVAWLGSHWHRLLEGIGLLV